MTPSSDEWQRQLDAWVSALHEGDLDDDQADALNRLLDSQPGARRRFAEQIQLLTMLETDRSVLTDVQADAQNRLEMASDETSAAGARSRLSLILMALAAGLVGMVLWVRPTRTDSPLPAAARANEVLDEGVAVVTRCVNTRWGSDGFLAVGNSVSPGRITLESGHVQFEFYRGAVVVVEGPADLEFVNANQLICHQGRLRAQVPPPAEGFEILSPSFELVDLGTEFGLDVASDGSANVRVFEGRVELYERDTDRTKETRTEIIEQRGARVSARGVITQTDSPRGDYISSERLDEFEQSYQSSRLTAWKSESDALSDDPRVIAHYSFEPDPNSRRVLESNSDRDGAIVGCKWSEGRWGPKGALEFKHPGDRVRINLPGEYDSLTYSAWVRIDGLDRPFIALVLTNGYDAREPHWQLRDDGRLLLGIQTPQGHIAYDSDPVLNLRDLGRWIHLATVYDAENREVCHYIDGKQVGRATIPSKPFKLKFGDTEIGNWGTPVTYSPQKIRNFNGRIDSLTLFGEALDGNEIQSLHASGRP